MATKDDALKKQEGSLRQTEKEMSEATRTTDGLYSRHGRGKQNSTKKERDADLQQQRLGANADSIVDFGT